MGFYSKVIADSVNDYGQRLTTLEVCYPRFIHSEIMTHRDRARNSASSRAIPWPKMMERINSDPVVPIKWGMEKKGMQAGEELPPHLAELANALWIKARNYAVVYADAIHNIGQTYMNLLNYPMGLSDEQIKRITSLETLDPNKYPEETLTHKVHKSLPNRVTEPWMWITVVMTATNWKNLERLRLHGDAEVHFQELMKHITESMSASEPRKLPFGEWHTPYVSEDEQNAILVWATKYNPVPNPNLIQAISTARCARVSYLTQDGKRDFEADLRLFNTLCQGSGFGHWSPHEHVAMSSTKDERSGPYRGWKQFRKLFAMECAD